MPSNVEIKAKLRDRKFAEALAEKLSGRKPEILRQEDVFFPCDGARLKLRILAPDSAELIRYERIDSAETRTSRYQLARTTDPQSLREILTKVLGVVGVVRKKRKLYLIGQTRVHIDDVEGLGEFLEFEVVLQPSQTEAEGKAIADELLLRFGIKKQDLLAQAYVDLLAQLKSPIVDAAQCI